MAMEEGKPVQLPPMHILIVDDIAQNIDLLSLLLSRSGHTVEVARDGQEALEKMNIPGIELVLMDLQMPVLDGLEASLRSGVAIDAITTDFKSSSLSEKSL